MNGDSVRTATLVLATVTTGLSAGVFVDWSITIMPGLEQVDDRAFVSSFRALDAAITNPLFLGVEFTGALVLTGLAAVLHRRVDQRQVLLWVAAALAGTLVVWVVTFAVNEPLNEKLSLRGPSRAMPTSRPPARCSTKRGGLLGTPFGRSPQRSPSAAWPGRWRPTAAARREHVTQAMRGVPTSVAGIASFR